MPNVDGGHYFYTGLFPVHREPCRRGDGSITIPLLRLREALATLPNFTQVPSGRERKPDRDRISPFARCRRTHLARFAVIDDVAFEGRDPVDAIANAARGALGGGVDLLVHQPVDHLSRAWLLFAADFDAREEGARDLWAAGLWEEMAAELKVVFGNCRGFEGVDSGAAFAAYLARGQVETTMSFNDYYVDPPNFAQPVKGIVLTALVVAAAVIAASVWLNARLHAGGWVIALGVLVALAAAAWLIYRLMLSRGRRPFPTAPDSDLKSVLKGLYLRRHLTDFAMAQQGADDAALHAAFGRFLEQVRPGDLDEPTQTPGVLRA